tara:strand:+ start:144 stop:869 length:726 start_codon:yes stop_codon:yes gene_type:complete
MKKLASILAATILSVSVSSVNAEMISVGISGNIGILDASGKETFNSKTQTKSEEMFMGYASAFAELHVPMEVGPGKFRVGASYVPYALESEATSSQRAAGESANTSGTPPCLPTNCVSNPKAAFSQNVQVDIEALTSMYVSYHVNSFFLKAGVMEATLKTNESLGSGSSYGDAALEGSFFALGYDKSLSNGPFDGMFIRGEVSVSEFDPIRLTNSGSDNSNVIDITNIDGTNVAFSIGKSF